MRIDIKLSIIAKCRTNQKNVIQEQGREKEERILSLKFRVFWPAQIAKLQSIHILFVRNAVFITGNKFWLSKQKRQKKKLPDYENFPGSPAQETTKNSRKLI